MGEYSDCPGPLADDGGDLGDLQAAERPQGHNLGLVGCQHADQPQSVLCPDAVHRLGTRIVPGRQQLQPIVAARLVRAARSARRRPSRCR